jgi:hypothetical protein
MRAVARADSERGFACPHFPPFSQCQFHADRSVNGRFHKDRPANGILHTCHRPSWAGVRPPYSGTNNPDVLYDADESFCTTGPPWRSRRGNRREIDGIPEEQDERNEHRRFTSVERCSRSPRHSCTRRPNRRTARSDRPLPQPERKSGRKASE